MKAHRYFPGQHCRLRRTPRGTVVSATAVPGQWRHPWSLDAQWLVDDAAPKGEWRAFVQPGFVNGRDAYVGDVALTDDPAPWLALTAWRDPVQPAGFSDASTGDRLILLPGEGYPKFFETLGVGPVAKGGDAARAAAGAVFDPERTHQLRAMDVVLRIPRIGTRLDYTASNPLAQQQTQIIDTRYTTEYYNQVGGRSILRAVDKFTPPSPDNLMGIYGQLLDTGSAGYDDVPLATVFMVSPPDYSPEDAPDLSWSPWVQYRPAGFWNLNSATNLIPGHSDRPIRLQLPLAGGLAQPVFDALLTFVNDQNAEAAAFLDATQAQGYQWSV